MHTSHLFLVPARRIAVAGSAAILFSACGGGGGSDSDAPIAVSYSPGTIEQTYEQHFDRRYLDSTSPQFVTVTATFASPPPAGTVAVRLLMSELVFGPGPITFTTALGSATAFYAVVMPDQMLNPGLHEGDVSIQLCRNAACSAFAETTGRLHYKLDVRAGLKVTLKVNGVEFTNPDGATPGTPGTQMFTGLPAGGRADFTSTTPVTWALGGQAPSNFPCNITSDVTVNSSTNSPTALSFVVDKHIGRACDLQVTATTVQTPRRTAAYALRLPAN